MRPVGVYMIVPTDNLKSLFPIKTLCNSLNKLVITNYIVSNPQLGTQLRNIDCVVKTFNVLSNDLFHPFRRNPITPTERTTHNHFAIQNSLRNTPLQPSCLIKMLRSFTPKSTHQIKLANNLWQIIAIRQSLIH